MKFENLVFLLLVFASLKQETKIKNLSLSFLVYIFKISQKRRLQNDGRRNIYSFMVNFIFLIQSSLKQGIVRIITDQGFTVGFLSGGSDFCCCCLVIVAPSREQTTRANSGLFRERERWDWKMERAKRTYNAVCPPPRHEK